MRARWIKALENVSLLALAIVYACIGAIVTLFFVHAPGKDNAAEILVATLIMAFFVMIDVCADIATDILKAREQEQEGL